MQTRSVLIVEASARQRGSLTRRLAAEFARCWKEAHPGDTLLRRDVGREPPRIIDESWMAAAFTTRDERTPSQRQALSLSDTLIGEIRAADLIVIATPMYNYGMPAALKAWFDQVVRINETFDFDLARGDFPLQPMLRRKQVLALTSCGEFGFQPGGVRQDSSHLVPHLKTLSKYLGAEGVHHIGIEYQEFADERHERSICQAMAAIVPAIGRISGSFEMEGESSLRRL